MPLVKRRRTILRALRDVVIAPFALILGSVTMNWLWMLVILVLMLSSMWMAREPLANLVPGMETIFIMLAVIVFVALATIPLSIRDYFSHHGYETVWQASDESVSAAKKHADLIVSKQYASFYDQFREIQKSEMSLDDMTKIFVDMAESIGDPTSIIDAEETEIYYAVYSDVDYDGDIDAIVQIVLEHGSSDKQSVLTLSLDCRNGYKIATFQHTAYET